MDNDDDIDITGPLRDSVADFLGGHPAAASRDAVLGAPQPVDRALWRELAELGWLSLALPEPLGGLGLGLREATVLTEQFGRAAFLMPYVAATVMPAALLSVGDDSPLVQELAASMAGGERLLTLAWQEHVGEIDPERPSTRVDAGRLYGRKCFVAAVEDDSILLVTAVSGDELVVVAVEAGAGGVTKRVSASGGGTLAEVTFDGARILHDRPLLTGKPAGTALNRALEAGRVALAAQLAGLAAGCLEKTVRYVGDRVQFARPIGSFQTIRHRCVDLHIAIGLADASWRHAASSQTPDAVSAAKARCGDTALRVTREAIQMHGAMGFTEEGGIGRYARAALADSSWLGSPAAHRRRFLSAREEASHA